MTPNVPVKPARAGNTGKLISSYYLEIEYLLDRVEQSNTYYQALALERSATPEDVVRAYQETIKVLHPPYYKVRAAISDDILERIDKSFSRVSQAFFVLTDHSRKVEYDRSLSRSGPVTTFPVHRSGTNSAPLTSSAPLATPAPINAPQPEAPASLSQAGAEQEAINVRNSVVGQPVYSKAVEDASTVINRRRCERFKLSMPILLVGHDRLNGRWQEVGKTIDVSKMGVGITMSRRVQPGLVLHLNMPLPTKLRSHGYSDPSYQLYAIVRRAEPIRNGTRVIGLEFLSEHPPPGYLNDPWCAFRTQKWPGVDRRREPRVTRSEAITIEYLDDDMESLRKETAVTENTSHRGMRIRVKTPSPESDILKITSRSRNFSSLAVVRNRYVGKDGFERLCLQFTENKWLV
ncbi:MAG TPA: PilZ domain-containing protein [Blastocatellia bacterium]|nr:PilZ domain-containing protein [Blastocatellia bacterium]